MYSLLLHLVCEYVRIQRRNVQHLSIVKKLLNVATIFFPKHVCVRTLTAVVATAIATWWSQQQTQQAL